MLLRRELGRTAESIDDSSSEPAAHGNDVNGQTEEQTLDMVIVGAGFAGIWLLNRLRQRGFKAKIVEVNCSV